MTPLETDEVIDQDKVGNPERPLEPAPVSFLQVDGPGVVAENWKAAEDGNGTVLRLLEIAGTQSRATMRFPLLRCKKRGCALRWKTTSGRFRRRGRRWKSRLKPHEIATLRILGEFQQPNP